MRHHLRFARHYRDVRAPRVLGLERRLAGVGGFCDCEIFFNGWQRADLVGAEFEELEQTSEVPARPPCLGARKGSTKPCAVWVRIRRRW